MADYQILIHDGVGHPHFLDGGIVTIKPSGAHWSDGELAQGILKTISINLTEAQYNELSGQLLDFKANNKANPSAFTRGR